MKKNRIIYLDLAKGFAIIFMFAQHCMLVHETGAGDSSHWLSLLFVLLGTAPAAPVFMIIMGAFMMKSQASLRTHLLRGVKLLVLGYLLNLLRFPMILPTEYGDGEFFPLLLTNFFSLVDILQLAGISLILGAFLKPVMKNSVAPPLFFTAVFLVSPYLWGITPENPLTVVLWGTSENVFFPFFPWLVYPLLGMYLSKFLLQSPDVLDSTLNKMTLIGVFLFAAGSLLSVLEIFPLGDYSRSGLGIHLIIIGFVLIWLKICRLMEQKMPPDNRFFRAMTFLSVNITVIYYIQWILFAWSTVPLGANQQGPYTSALIGLAVSVVTVFLAGRKVTKKVLFFL
ncbi:MAG: acyltransferase [Spirochaetales bacterium]|nr:acyltransferase [Spirochaetales bacterium]